MNRLYRLAVLAVIFKTYSAIVTFSKDLHENNGRSGNAILSVEPSVNSEMLPSSGQGGQTPPYERGEEVRSRTEASDWPRVRNALQPWPFPIARLQKFQPSRVGLEQTDRSEAGNGDWDPLVGSETETKHTSNPFRLPPEELAYQAIQNNFEEESEECLALSDPGESIQTFLNQYPTTRYSNNLKIMNLWTCYTEQAREGMANVLLENKFVLGVGKMYGEYLEILKRSDELYTYYKELLHYPPHLIHCRDFELLMREQREFLRQYPNGVYTKDIERLLVINYHRLAAYHIWLTLYFFDYRQDLLRAANTALETFQKYPRSVAAVQALGILAVCYEELHLTELAEAAKALFEANQKPLWHLNLERDSCYEWAVFAEKYFPNSLPIAVNPQASLDDVDASAGHAERLLEQPVAAATEPREAKFAVEKLPQE